jgi:dolichol kinase
VPELGRRAVHLAGTAVPAAYLLDVLAWRELRLLLAAAAVGVALLEVARLRGWFGGRPMGRVYAALTREYERHNVAGYALFAWSTALVAWLFAPSVAVPGMLALAVGDPVAGVLGRRLDGDADATDADGGDRTDDADDAGAAGDGDAGAAGDGNADDAGDGDAGASDGRVAGGSVGVPSISSRAKPPVVLAATFLVCLALAAPFTVAVAGVAVGGLAAAAGALGATLADGVKPVVAGRVVDDNLTMAPAACAGIWAVLRIAAVTGA